MPAPVVVAPPTPRLVIYQVGGNHGQLDMDTARRIRIMIDDPSTRGVNTASARSNLKAPSERTMWLPGDTQDSRSKQTRQQRDTEKETRKNGKKTTTAEEFQSLKFYEGPMRVESGMRYTIFLKDETRIQWDSSTKLPFYHDEGGHQIKLPVNVIACDSFLGAALSLSQKSLSAG